MYTNTQRQIYQFPNSNRKADPLELKRHLTIYTEGRLSELVNDYNEGDTELVKALAEEKLIQAARKTFALKSITEPDGVADSVVLEYLAHFLEWLLIRSNQSIDHMPISSPCVDCNSPSVIPPSPA